MKTVKSYDGKKDVNISSFQESLNRFASNNIRAGLSDDGEAYLLNVIESSYACGCRIKGNGTIQFPLSIAFCRKHKN